MPASHRPQNHVSAALMAALAAHRPRPDEQEPAWTEEQLAWMEKTFPPRCLGRAEPVEAHLRYAGVVEFVQNRRAIHEDRKAKGDPEDSANMEHV